VSSPAKLPGASGTGVHGISLNYHESRYIENQFFFASKIYDEVGGEHNRCYDVFLLVL
jgi:hypothetical protein